jgi:hypothetical protein
MSTDKPKMHTEVLYPLDPEFGQRHRMQEFRDPGYTGPWSGDRKYLYDERCPKCTYNAGIEESAQLVDAAGLPILGAEIRTLQYL